VAVGLSVLPEVKLARGFEKEARGKTTSEQSIISIAYSILGVGSTT
jgi:hypothetical protein